MTNPIAPIILALGLVLPLAACQEATERPAAIVMSDEALGHYCQMYLADHGGPKGQIHVAGFDQPLWFSQVSDAVAYIHDPEREGDIRAVYVTDMAAAPSWAEPGRDNWIDAEAAFFVIDSRQQGGMGVPDAIPFSTRAAAERFAGEKGGRIVGLKEIPEAYVRPDLPPAAGLHDAGAAHEG